MSNDIKNLDMFDWYYKDLFNWESKSYNKKAERIVFCGEKKDDNDFMVFLKKIKVNNNFQHILKEIYFLACCHKNNNYIRIVDVFLSDDKEYIFLILKNEGISLDYFIDYNDNFDIREVTDMIKWITFQIIKGLNVLHKNNLVHNDIKPSNIVISNIGLTKICDLGSVDKTNEKGHGTFYYNSPNVLLGNNSSPKDDMWGVGIIMIELYQKKSPFFNYKSLLSSSYDFNHDKKQRNNFQLKAILSKYKISFNNMNGNLDYDFDYIKTQIIEKNNYENYNFKAELKNIEGINDFEALDLIKNLLEINPNKRFNAEQALNSQYLSKYNIENSEISYKEDDYNKYIKSAINKEIFVKNLTMIKQKFLGEVLFD